MNIWHYRDNRDTWLYYCDGRIFIIAQPYSYLLRHELKKNFFACLPPFKYLATIQLQISFSIKLYAKQKHLGRKKVRGQSEATLQTGRHDQKCTIKGGQVTKPIIYL